VILVDTCVLIDVFDADPRWSDWSRRQLDAWSNRGPLLINPVIYSELAADFDTIESLDAVLDQAGLDLRELPREALYVAGKAHLRYRHRGGTRTGVLSEFFIGAHASVLNVPVLTRDTTRYRAYSGQLRLIAPTPPMQT
jgi:predicted nucleic acid-binding protein